MTFPVDSRIHRVPMEFYRVSLEAYRHGATIYVAAFCRSRVADGRDRPRMSLETGVVRMDLRAVDVIDPDCSCASHARSTAGARIAAG